MDLKPTPHIPVKRPQQELRIVKKFVRKAFDNSWITSRASIANSRSTGKQIEDDVRLDSATVQAKFPAFLKTTSYQCVESAV